MYYCVGDYGELVWCRIPSGPLMVMCGAELKVLDLYEDGWVPLGYKTGVLPLCHDDREY